MSDLEQFEVWLREQDRSVQTVRGYLADLRQFAAWFEGTNGKPLRVQDVTPTDVREYRGWLQTVRQAGAATVRHHLMAIRAYCRWAMAMAAYLAADPTACGSKMPRETESLAGMADEAGAVSAGAGSGAWDRRGGYRNAAAVGGSGLGSGGVPAEHGAAHCRGVRAEVGGRADGRAFGVGHGAREGEQVPPRAAER